MTTSSGLVTQLPFVSVVIPLYNDAHFVGRCLRSILDQDYPANRYEILIVDGGSSDGSLEVVQRMAVASRRILVLHNSARIVSTAMNRGIEQARGQVIVRVDSHCLIEKDYLGRCVEALRTSGAANVGGPMRPIGSGLVGGAMALATCTPFGIGNSRFHYVTESAELVDSVYLGAFRRDVFEKVGLFDPRLARNQDDEFNYRLRIFGERVLLVPEIKSWYFCRTSLRAIWRQYFGYGYWKVLVIAKHRRLFAARHLAPPLFVTGVLLGAATGVTFGQWLIFLLCTLPYLAVNATVSVRISANKGWRFLGVLPAVFATIHGAYGLGFLAGAFRCLPLAIVPRRRQSETSPSPVAG